VTVVRACASADELAGALAAIGHYFGLESSLEDAERFAQWLDVERMHAAWDGERIVGGAGAFSFQVSVPGGGSVQAGGVTVVGVLPTHRRQGVLTSLMKAQLADCRARGNAVTYLWASEATIYGRFGYGLASRIGELTLARERARFAFPFELQGTVRLVELDEAARTFPPLYEQLLAERPGMFARSMAWWETRTLFDDPARRRGAGPLNRALLSLGGEPAGYALYRVKQDWAEGSSDGEVSIVEVVTPTAAATRELWRWLLDFDWTARFAANLLPLDHPLFLLLAEPRRMRFRLNDGLWVRIIDLQAALAARSYTGEGHVVLEVEDAFLPENNGRWHVSAKGVERTTAGADLHLDVTGVGSVYLGGFGFTDLVRAARAEELRPGAAERADALFGRWAAPWCPEIF
jgi:predicted acetyltransferase